ncbi:MAG: dTMP kinase [Endomicrobium sp.]|jgi:dTMP kinase|nr:dTMP kinase [Endomicrobium sp.]
MNKNAKKWKTNKNIFITFEGGEGAGKTTQAILLTRYLKRIGYQVIFTREPGGETLSNLIRNIVLNKSLKICALSELLLYEAARAQHTKDIILPALKAKQIVICDRFIDSTIAYQGYGRGTNLKLINQLNKITSYRLKPTITIYLDIVPSIGLNRGIKQLHKDRIENSSIQFHNKVRNGYLIQAKKYSSRIFFIKANNLRKTQMLIRLMIKKLILNKRDI